MVELAKQALESYVKTGKIISPPENPSGEMASRAGVFVCIKKQGQLRGCIGTIEPVTKNVSQEIIKNAIATGTEDPRFAPVDEEELGELQYTLDVLTPPEPVESMNALDPSQYGVIVKKGQRKGLLLPDLEGVDTVDEQLRIAKLKAGIGLNEVGVEIQRFEVRRYK